VRPCARLCSDAQYNAEVCLMPVNRVIVSDCNLGIEFLILASGIEKFVIPVSRDPVFGIRFID